jgi:hypothetical protein
VRVKNASRHNPFKHNEHLHYSFREAIPLADPDLQVFKKGPWGLTWKMNKNKLITGYDGGSDGIPYQPHSEIQWYRDKDGKLRSHATPGNGFLSAADPVGQAYLEGVALGPIANKLFRAGKGILKRGAEKLLPKTANKALANTATASADVPFYDITSTEGKAAIDNTFARGMDTYADYLSSPWV